MDYNHYRPHSSLDYMAPAAFAVKCLEQGFATLRLPQDQEIQLRYSHSNWYNKRGQDSTQSWSSNSRWIAFSSKREYGIFTRTYLSYIDEKGEAYKPILLPQKNPEFYDYCLETYTVPELVTSPVKVTRKKLMQTICISPKIKADLPTTMATPASQTMPTYVESHQERE
jgi:hypothetical protein